MRQVGPIGRAAALSRSGEYWNTPPPMQTFGTVTSTPSRAQAMASNTAFRSLNGVWIVLTPTSDRIR
jgi:hypothetical protein